MPLRSIFLVSSRNSQGQRAHFSIFVPSASSPSIGTSIHVVGAPIMGYELEFRRNHTPSVNEEPYEMISIGQVESSNIVDSSGEGNLFVDHTPRDNLEIAASQVPPPPISENFMAPVNDSGPMEYVHRLIARGLIGEEAAQIVQSKRDPPTHGIGLQLAVRRLA
ncbi:uncharacterized protein BO80DRAFT_457262 [Aspergillus ibericus CBS 121593]|uniref:Uncharacterized protein n=1 Tax=Aspergillus ibericus CBS 121593 TaxID=1448316 RepID=A0A395GSW7_9EURO|nr:hypothetical protein BO80DRAFT_457262 [Aspergillus ibericus CBS 121593]RAK98680.1 hypothetical protein BO80DRAFT_457262 [Aspergillus ibericus CBS 121593]